jgi:hypothetical protein
MLPVIASIVSGLIANGMPKVADAVIEKGVDYVQDKMGITLKPEGEATKEDYAKWNEAAAKHEEFMAEMDQKNMDGARNMQLAAMQSEDPLVRRFAYYFMGTWSLFAMIVIPCLIWVPIPEGQMRFADAFQGFLLGTIVAGMFQFLLGSSLGSRNKDKK